MEALDKAGVVEPDVILLDIVLPEMDGFMVLRKLRGDANTQPLIVMLTNLGQKDDIERGMRLGANDYIIKAHFTPSEVVEKVRKLLAKRK